MQNPLRLVCGLIVCLVCAMALPASAIIYIDEDFEGSSLLVDRNYPVTGRDAVPTVGSIALKGMNLRTYDNAAADWTEPKAQVVNSGTQTAERFFRGSKSLKLVAGQAIGLTGGHYANDGKSTSMRMIQFALSASPATAALAAGTVVGSFKQGWSLTTTTDPEAYLSLLFRVTSDSRIEIFCENTNTVVGSFSAAPGNWAMISVVSQDRVEEGHADTAQELNTGYWSGGVWNGVWKTFDPLTQTYKGPLTGSEPT